jgi:hypothetical protein
MRIRKLGQSLGRLVAIVAFSAGAASGIQLSSAVYGADSDGNGLGVVATEQDDSPDEYQWD